VGLAGFQIDSSDDENLEIIWLD